MFPALRSECRKERCEMGWFSRSKHDAQPTAQQVRTPPSQPLEKSVDDYVNDFSRMLESWKTKSDILSDVAQMNRVGVLLRQTKGEQFCREVVEALSRRSFEHAQALGSAWKIEWVDKGSHP